MVIVFANLLISVIIHILIALYDLVLYAIIVLGLVIGFSTILDY